MTHADRNDEVDLALQAISDQRWSGPEQHERIEQLIREVRQMKQQTSKRFSKGMLIAIGVAGVLGGGAVASAVTHQMMSQRAILTTEDGVEYEVILNPTAEGAAGSFVTDDGAVYGIDSVEQTGQTLLTIDTSGMDADENAEMTSTVTIEGEPNSDN